MKEIKFADINEIPLRNYFKREAEDFTPWLKDNINLLGETIGIELIDPETEVLIGNYRLDIKATESGSNRIIAIENQFETTDHSHLGQLITYMAGLDAKVVVWIAENFRDEHITAINHLNQISNNDISFFCIRPRLIKIGNSDPALEFVIIAQPDEWEKTVKNEGKVNDREKAYLEFWDYFLREYTLVHPEFKFKRACKYNSYNFNAGKPYISYGLRFGKNHKFMLTLWIETPDLERNHEIVDMFIEQKDTLEKEIGASLRFFKKDGTKLTTVNLGKKIQDDIMSLSDNEKREIIDWIIEWLPKFMGALDSVIKDI